MSDDKENKALALKATTDIVGIDRERLDKFIEDGLPGIGSVEQPQIDKMLELYILDQSYSSISGICRVPKVIVMYFSERQNWLATRQEYYRELITSLPKRLAEADVLAKDVMVDQIRAYHKKYTDKRKRFLATGVEDASTRIDPKEQAVFLKTVEMSKKITVPSEPKAPIVNVNVGNKATFSQTGDKTIEVTANEDTRTQEEIDEDMLRRLANSNRDKEKK